MAGIYRSSNPRQDFNDWQESHSGSGIHCCICGHEINDDEAICWHDEYCHVDEGCAFDFWIEHIKEDLKERIE